MSGQQPQDQRSDQPSAEPHRSIGSICVYCASSTGSNPTIIAAAEELGRLMAEQNIELVYGGGAVGLMGLIADTVMAGGGTVTGVIPTALMPREVAHRGITSLIEVTTMHERKAEMMDRADGFIAMPGGFGTLEELAEVLTWAQLGLHRKPIGLLNVDSFYDHLLLLLDRCIEDRVLKEKNRLLLIDRADPGELLEALRTTSTAFEPKWLDTESS